MANEITGLDKLNENLSQLVSRIQNMQPAYAEIGGLLVSEAKQNFAAQGFFQNLSNFREAWAPSQRVLRKGGRTLRLSGKMENSISSRPFPDHVEIGTNVPYAAVLQFGSQKKVQVRQFVRRVKARSEYGRSELRTSKRTGKKYYAREMKAQGIGFVKAHARQMNLTPRPFITFSQRSREGAAAIVAKYLLGGIA